MSLAATLADARRMILPSSLLKNPIWGVGYK